MDVTILTGFYDWLGECGRLDGDSSGEEKLKRNSEQIFRHKSEPASGTGTPDIAACVLAGGRSTRMGEDKRHLIFQGATLFQRALALAEGYCPRYVSLAADDPLEEVPGFTIVRDRIEGRGPLGGISEVLAMSTQAWVLFFPCDMPLLDVAALLTLAERRSPDIDALFFTESGIQRLFPLLLHTAAAGVFCDAVQSGKLKLSSLIATHLRTETVEATGSPFYRPEMFANINSKEDYRRVLNTNAVHCFGNTGDT